MGFAGEVNAIAIDAFNDSEILTAVKNGSGNLELIAWRCAPTDTEVTRVSDSGSQAGSIGGVALSVILRTAITAVRNGSGNLFMILWNMPPGIGSITRTWDSGTTAGEASRIAMALLPSNIIVTAVRNGSGNLGADFGAPGAQRNALAPSRQRITGRIREPRHDRRH